MKRSPKAGPYNVLYAHPTAEIGGAGLSLLNLIEKMDRNKFKPLVVLPKEGDLSRRVGSLAVPVIISSLNDGSKRQPWPFIKSVWELSRFILRKRIDLVHANFERCNRPVSVAARLTGRPQICHVRNIQNKGSVRHFFLGLSPYLIANSKATESSYRKYVRLRQETFVIYNGIDLSWFRPQEKQGNFYGIENDVYIIAQVSRIVPEKGVHTFVEALAKVISKSNGSVFGLIVGDTSTKDNKNILNKAYLHDLKDRISALALNKRVIFTGFVEDMRSIYSRINLLVQPSESESFGRTLIEAMAMNVPVITTRVGGAVEVVEDNKTGFLVPSGDEDSLVRAIFRIMDNPEMGKRITSEARRTVEKRFSIEKYIRGIERVYQRILGARA